LNNQTAKIAFIGEPGSGKTTCIGALSEIAPVRTDVGCTDELASIKETTTVALDYGELSLDDGGRLLLYGLPGQSRFHFMFDVIREGLLGIIVLVDGASSKAVEGLAETLQTYAQELRIHPCVVAINKLDEAPQALRERCLQLLRDHHVTAPVSVIDARRKEDIVRITGLLLTIQKYTDSCAGEIREA
jgi:signal recognition particle receptor subunit beta